MRNPAQWRHTLGQSRWCGNRETQPEGTLLSRSLRADPLGPSPNVTNPLGSCHQKKLAVLSSRIALAATNRERAHQHPLGCKASLRFVVIKTIPCVRIQVHGVAM